MIKNNIKGSHVFSGLTNDELESIVRVAAASEYAAGTTIFHEGGPANHFMVVGEGRVAVQLPVVMGDPRSNRMVTVDMLNAGEVIGWSALVEPYVYTMRAVALQNTRVISVSGVVLRQLLSENHHMGYEVMKRLCQVVASRLNEARQLLATERVGPGVS